jgi:hypothetical protein
MEKFLEYHLSAKIHLLSPTPLLLVVADHDTLTPGKNLLNMLWRGLTSLRYSGVVFPPECVPGLRRQA